MSQQEDCDNLINLDKLLVINYDVDVFISEKVPRYDAKAREHGGLLEGLNNTSNSILHMRTHLLDRVYVVKQSMLESKSERVRNERFQPDGLHLTEKGLQLVNTNWVDSIKRVFTDLPQSPPQQHGRPHVPLGAGRGGGGQERGGRTGQQWRDENYSDNYGSDQGRGGGYRENRGFRGGNRGGGFQNERPHNGQFRRGNNYRGGRWN